MKLRLFVALLGIIAISAWADDFDPAPVGDARDQIVVGNLPPVKDQDGLGLCYAFSASTMLEAHLCRVSPSSCANGSDYEISPLYLGSLLRGKVRELKAGGDPLSSLRELKAYEGQSAVRESCAPSDALTQTREVTAGGATYRQSNEFVGWDRVVGYYQSYKRGGAGAEPCAHAIQDLLSPKMQLSLDQVMTALGKGTPEEYLANLLVPQQCLQLGRRVQVPDYSIHQFPNSWGEKTSKAELLQALRNVLSAGIPAEISICFRTEMKNGSRECSSAHATMVTGIKNVCRDGTCRLAIRLQNSYGQGWQEQFDGGWVDGDQLLDRALEMSADGGSPPLAWLTRPDEKIAVAPPMSNVPLTSNPQPNRAPPVVGPPGSIYKCVDENGSIRFTDQPEVGCVLRRR